MENSRRSALMFIASMLIFGTIGIFRRYLPFSSAFLAFARGVTGGLFLLLFVRLKRREPGAGLSKRVFLRLAVTGAVMGVNWILLFEAYSHTTVAVATLCYYMQPTIVMLLSPVLFGERLTLKKGLCAAAAVAGMILVSGADSGGGGSPKGVLLGLGAALFYAGVVILNKKTPGVDPYRKTIIQLFSAGLVMIPYLLLSRSAGAGAPGPSAVLLLMVVGVVHTGLAYVLYFGSMDGLQAQTIALLGYIDPVSALLFSAVFLGEPLRLAGLLGAALIIGSAILGETGGKRGG